MAILSYEEYYSNLFLIEGHKNLPHLAVFAPNSERIFNIDLESKIIDSPEFLSVEHDHTAETVYFLVDRYFDNMDLSQTCCVIQYVNAKGEGRMYTVPFYDVETYLDENKMLVPWCIEGEATKAAGEVTYAIRFFKVNGSNTKITFQLNTLPATSKILHTINVMDFYPITLSEDLYQPGKYYLKTGDSYTISWDSFNPRKQYYSQSEKENLYPASDLEVLQNRIVALEREFAVYWYDAGVDNLEE